MLYLNNPNSGRHNGGQHGLQQNAHKKREKRGIRKRGERKEIVTTLGSRGVGDKRGNPPVMGARNVALCNCAFYSLNLRPQSHLLKTYMGSFSTVLNIPGGIPDGSLPTEHVQLIGVVVLGTFQGAASPFLKETLCDLWPPMVCCHAGSARTRHWAPSGTPPAPMPTDFSLKTLVAMRTVPWLATML